MTPRMQRMREQLGQATAKTKRVLEVNPESGTLPDLATFNQALTDIMLRAT